MKTVATDSAPRAIGPYSQAVVVNGMVYTSGQIPLTADGRLVSHVRSNDGTIRQPVSDFIIDCTGLEADIAEHRVFADLLEYSGAYRNPLGRLEVERHFEVKGTASGDGALYASGSATLGGYFPGVDTFLGLQIAAQEIADDLAKRGFCRKMGPLRSTVQWFKWAFNKPV